MKEKNVRVEDSENVTHPSPSAKASPVLLNFGSLGLSGCTMTQQRYFAQEAIDCAKAFLEDDEVADQAHTSDRAKRSAEDINGELERIMLNKTE